MNYSCDVGAEREVCEEDDDAAVFFASFSFANCASWVLGSGSADPPCAEQMPGRLLFLYHPTAFEGQALVAKFPVAVQ